MLFNKSRNGYGYTYMNMYIIDLYNIHNYMNMYTIDLCNIHIYDYV